MITLDPNWIMAIIAISAILSPTIVSIIDNISKYKSKKLELDYPKQREALSNFISSAMEYYVAESFVYVTKYVAAKNNLYVYFSNIPNKELDKLEELQLSRQLSEYKKCLNNIAIKLSQQISK